MSDDERALALLLADIDVACCEAHYTPEARRALADRVVALTTTRAEGFALGEQSGLERAVQFVKRLSEEAYVDAGAAQQEGGLANSVKAGMERGSELLDIAEQLAALPPSTSPVWGAKDHVGEVNKIIPKESKDG